MRTDENIEIWVAVGYRAFFIYFFLLGTEAHNEDNGP